MRYLFCFYCLILGFLLFFPRMVEVWGQLPKAQDNAQTIDEAIASAIASHESDPQAHLGTGESLETHRANETIDHPAGSIVLDKFNANEYFYSTFFETLTGWSQTGDVAISGFSSLQIYAGTETVSLSRITTALLSGFFVFDSSRDWILQAVFLCESSLPSGVKYLFGATDTSFDEDAGAGFVFDNDRVRGWARFGTSTVYTSDITFDNTQSHTYRVFYLASENEVRFYIDGVLVASLSDDTNDLVSANRITLSASNSVEEAAGLIVQQLSFGGTINPNP